MPAGAAIHFFQGITGREQTALAGTQRLCAGIRSKCVEASSSVRSTYHSSKSRHRGRTSPLRSILARPAAQPAEIRPAIEGFARQVIALIRPLRQPLVQVHRAPAEMRAAAAGSMAGRETQGTPGIAVRRGKGRSLRRCLAHGLAPRLRRSRIRYPCLGVPGPASRANPNLSSGSFQPRSTHRLISKIVSPVTLVSKGPVNRSAAGTSSTRPFPPARYARRPCLLKRISALSVAASGYPVTLHGGRQPRNSSAFCNCSTGMQGAQTLRGVEAIAAPASHAVALSTSRRFRAPGFPRSYLVARLQASVLLSRLK
jgi:hypothetical protein